MICSPPPEEFHFEDSQILSTIQASRYFKAQIAYYLRLMTSEEKWSLYRAVVALADAQRETKSK